MEHALRKIQDRLQERLKLKKVGGGSKYFGGAKRGETAELANDLNGTDKDKQKQAVKRIIANMTLGRDVSSLFVDVVKLGHTFNIELKKLVYLYILNTAKMQQDKALLAVNTFLQDSGHQSPIIRALAIRTMMCLRVDSVTEYTLEPLRRATSDSDPYVRKTAAIGIGKLFHQNRRLFLEQGFLQDVLRMLGDGYPVVSSNAAIVLCEVVGSGAVAGCELTDEHLVRLINAVPEATEWGQCHLLETLATYAHAIADPKSTIERTLSRLGHTNAAVVMAAVKLIAVLLPRCVTSELMALCSQRITQALLTFTKADHETQFIVFKNIMALLVMFPDLFSKNLDAFYLRYNDPAYVKLEKLSLLLKLTTVENASQVLRELQEATNEVDVLFVKEVVSAIGRVALKVEPIAPQCAQFLQQLAGKRTELLPAILNASKNIVRKYPQLLILDSLIRDHGADAVGEEEAKVSFVWMLGEFCDFIEGGPELLQSFLENLLTQEPSVQLSLLTAVVKLFLRNPDQLEPILTSVLETLTQKSKHPDIRDRAYGYWRLLAKGVGVEAMKRIVHGAVAPVDADRHFADGITVGDLRASLNTAAVVYGKPPRAFLPSYGITTVVEDEYDDDDDIIEVEDGHTPADGGYGQQQQAEAAPAPVAAPTPAAAYVDPLEALFSGGPTPSSSTSAPPQAKPAAGGFDPNDPFAPMPAAPISFGANANTAASNPFGGMMGGAQPSASTAVTTPPPPQHVHQDGEMAVSAVVNSSDNTLTLVIRNNGFGNISGLAMQINRSTQGFQPARPIAECFGKAFIGSGAAETIVVPLTVSAQHTLDASQPPSTSLEVGLKTNNGLVRFFSPIAANVTSPSASASGGFGFGGAVAAPAANKPLTVDDLFA